MGIEKFGEGGGERTAPWAGYWRASAMWSDESLEGRASRALRNDLQNASSAMVGDIGCRCAMR